MNQTEKMNTISKKKLLSFLRKKGVLFSKIANGEIKGYDKKEAALTSEIPVWSV